MRPDPNLRPDSLMQKIRSARQSDASFRRAHRTVQIIMASWAVIVVLDRLIGLVSHSYTGSSLPFALAGGAVLVGIAFLGARGHIQGALMVMQINMAVFLVQFAATCFLYREHTALWSTLFYGVSAGVLIAGSLMLFLRRDLKTTAPQCAASRGSRTALPVSAAPTAGSSASKNKIAYLSAKMLKNSFLSGGFLL